MSQIIYKIAPSKLWERAEKHGVFKGAEIDLADGFIHFSTKQQVRETAAKHFSGRDDLLLIKVATAPMARHYKMEVSRGGALFPHLFAALPVSNAVEWQELPLSPDGAHVFPEDFPDQG